MHFSHIAARAFDRPLLLEPRRGMTILATLAQLIARSNVESRLDTPRPSRLAMDDAGDLLSMIGRDRQHVVVAVDRGVRIAKDFPQFRIAEQTLDFVLNLLFHGRELLADDRQIGAR